MSRSISLTLPAIVLLFCACAKQMTDAQKLRLPRKRTRELVDLMDSLSHKKPQFFYTKIATDFSDTNRTISFKTSVRMVKDSAINALITYAAIPVVNAMITPDSVIVVNKRDKCMITKSLSYFKDNFGIAFNYHNVEELVLGMPLDYDTAQKYFQIHDPFNYTISSHRRREIKRLDRQEKNPKDDIIIKYFLSDSLTSLKGMLIESPSDSTSIRVDYRSREVVQNYHVPKDVLIIISSPRNQMRINMTYNKVTIDEPPSLQFVIPEGYEKCD